MMRTAAAWTATRIWAGVNSQAGTILPSKRMWPMRAHASGFLLSLSSLQFVCVSFCSPEACMLG
jgi:hypothetical protein